MDEEQLLEKLRRIETHFFAAGSEGERLAAAEAKERMLRRLREAEAADPPVEYRFSLADAEAEVRGGTASWALRMEGEDKCRDRHVRKPSPLRRLEKRSRPRRLSIG